MSLQSTKYPFVSVITPTYNRSKFFSSMVKIYKSQTYPKQYMEWIVFDDSPESSQELFEKLTVGIPNVRYIYSSEKQTIGAKRNFLNKEGKGDIFVAMDDDDYYPPDRVEYAVKQFQLPKYASYKLAGSSEMFVYYVSTGDIIKLGPYSDNHATNGTFAYKKEYAKTHFYDEEILYGEEVSFLENYSHPMIQLDPKKVMLVISHSENTFNKDDFLQEAKKNRNYNTSPALVTMTNMKLKDWIKDKQLYDFFNLLSIKNR